jgi:replication-associated recombination protein RarA
MKHVLCNTRNVREADGKLQYLLTRPRSEMVGLGLFYGAPGTGKTRYAMRTAFTNGHIYMRLEAAMTQRGFLHKLHRSLQYLYSMPSPMKGSTQAVYDEVLDMLIAAPDTVIFIDEMDYAFRHKAILGTIRDLVDQSLVTIILFGMQDAKNQLLALNAHYFDRCNAFAEFTNLSLEDTTLICNEAAEVEMDAETVKWVQKAGKGCARQIVKTVDWVERQAKAKGLNKVKLGDIQ